ncbi:MAG: hypothetical protein ACYC4U_00950 [Pirellulaceae bacterium]
MKRKVIFWLVMLVACFSMGTIARADRWKDESGHGKGRGHDRDEWREHSRETPDWGRGRGYQDGHFKHGYSSDRYRGHDGYYQRGHRDWEGDRYYGGRPNHPHYQRHHPSYRIPQHAPHLHYRPQPYSRGWDLRGSIYISPWAGW